MGCPSLEPLNEMAARAPSESTPASRCRPGSLLLPPPPLLPVVLLLLELSPLLLEASDVFCQRLLLPLPLLLLALSPFSTLLPLAARADFLGANRSKARGSFGGSVQSRRGEGPNAERRTHAAPVVSRESALIRAEALGGDERFCPSRCRPSLFSCRAWK